MSPLRNITECWRKGQSAANGRQNGRQMDERTAKAYAKEIEYCEENLEKLADACWEDEAFNRERLLERLAVKEKSLKGVFCGN